MEKLKIPSHTRRDLIPLKSLLTLNCASTSSPKATHFQVALRQRTIFASTPLLQEGR